MRPAAQLRGAEAVRGDTTIWSGVDLDLAAGEFVGILGPNGAGKSSFLEVLLGLLPLREGTASVLGAQPGERRERIGYLPQRRAFDESVEFTYRLLKTMSLSK